MFPRTRNGTFVSLRKAGNMTRDRVSHGSLFGSARACPKAERLGPESGAHTDN